jgi:hypothetical protein
VLKRRKASDSGQPEAREVAGDTIEDLELDDVEADPDAVTGGLGGLAGARADSNSLPEHHRQVT